MILDSSDTIAAISTPPGKGGIAVIRVSGKNARAIVNNAWKGSDLLSAQSHTAHLGYYLSVTGDVIDQVVATVFISPASFTGEDVVELSVHGSPWIQRELLADLIKRGARTANPGEFTQRAFLNGKIDLAQAEGVADLIASSSKSAHDLALAQTKGTFSKEFNSLRDKLIEFASLLELELDFSEEEVEFADRNSLVNLLKKIREKVDSLISSYARGAVLKNGVPVAIAGIPNAGKSSLLNLLLHEEKAIVTDIPGTTRDIIEDTIEIEGVLYRFIDTAGLRKTTDKVEEIGVNRALDTIAKAFVIIWVIDPSQPLESQVEAFANFRRQNPSKPAIILINKSDIITQETFETISKSLSDGDKSVLGIPMIKFSTHTSEGLQELIEKMNSITGLRETDESALIITNARHHEALMKASAALAVAMQGLESNLPTDLVAQDIREAISHLSTLTGSITTTDLLHSIFSRFCIGK